jgi:hypothetical protein
MTVHTCCLFAMLLAGPFSEGAAARPDALPVVEPDLLIARNEALADVNQLCAVLVLDGAEQTKSIVDYESLQTQVVEKLRTAGIAHVDCKTGLTPRLCIHIEAVVLSDCGRCVYRVQTALSRIVTFTDHRQLQVQADVWRLKPTMKAIADTEVADAVPAAVITQVEAFAGAYQAARRLQARAAAPQEPPAASSVAQRDRQKASGQDAGPAPFVASKNSSVFHRADCRMARNISEKNLVTYESREEAIQDGKRPCKSCSP